MAPPHSCQLPTEATDTPRFGFIFLNRCEKAWTPNVAVLGGGAYREVSREGVLPPEWISAEVRSIWGCRPTYAGSPVCSVPFHCLPGDDVIKKPSTDVRPLALDFLVSRTVRDKSLYVQTTQTNFSRHSSTDKMKSRGPWRSWASNSSLNNEFQIHW